MEPTANHKHHNQCGCAEIAEVSQFGKLENLLRGKKLTPIRLEMFRDAVEVERQLQKSFDQFTAQVIGFLLMHDNNSGVVDANDIEPALANMIAVQMNRVEAIITENIERAIALGQDEAEEQLKIVLGTGYVLLLSQRELLARTGLNDFLLSGAIRIPMSEQLAKVGSDLDFNIRSLVRVRSAMGEGIGDYKRTLQAIITGRETFSGQLTRRGSAYAKTAIIADTEANGAFHKGLRDYAEATDKLLGYEWVLSPRHPRKDVCDLLAGFHPVGDPVLAAFPAHLNCLCMLIPRYQ
jgi:hypothetical protein